MRPLFPLDTAPTQVPEAAIVFTRARVPEHARRTRFKLWELQSCWHCMVIGTCLSLVDVRQAAKKISLGGKATSDYALLASRWSNAAWIGLLAYICFSQIAIAQDSKPKISNNVVTNVYQPLHAEFATAAHGIAAASIDLCQRRPASSVYRMQVQFAQLVERYGAVEMFRVGPLLEDNRLNRLFYWPDTRRVAGRQLRTFTNSADVQSITQDRLAKKSVALQGFTALERLLFLPQYQPIETGPPCVLISAITHNIAHMAEELQVGWETDTEFVQALLHPASESAYFRSADEVLRSVYTQVKTGLDSLLDNKLQPLLSADEKQRQLAPFWISQRTSALLRGNVRGLQALLLESGMLDGTRFEKRFNIEFAFIHHLLRKLAPITHFMEPDGALTSEFKVLVHQLSAVLAGIRHTLNSEVAVELQLSAGFNSEDGD